MNDDLFANLPPMKSPRLLWMEKHGITVDHKTSTLRESWTAKMGLVATVSYSAELDALAELARKLNLKLWNE